MLDGCSLKSEYMISADALKLTLENRESSETEFGLRYRGKSSLKNLIHKSLLA